ncbi:hypothetical protein Glove_43g16 [Diversispora epigaea]|uniref:Uncharacterized protein n=1 Tax=Diversispora epigaea TaxID=1348612 RepID=A0A397JFR4_9GLOM|nr:hypothetical protein Glove_43g16 [Diversispora epigaea]
MWYRAMKAFKHAAKEYKVKHDKPAVIVYDNSQEEWNVTIFALERNGMTDSLFQLVILDHISKRKKKFDSSKLLQNQKYHKKGKQVINSLLNSKEIDTDVFRELFTNEKGYSEVLEANLFAYHPSRDTVSFQSRTIESYIPENFGIFVDSPTNEFDSNYASTSKS